MTEFDVEQGRPTVYRVGAGTNAYVSVDRWQFGDCLDIKVSTMAEGWRGHDEQVVLRIEPDAILDFMARVVQQGGYALTDALADTARGDCTTCGNRRLVERVSRGRAEDVYCPDCNPGGRLVDLLTTVPTMERARTRQEVEPKVDPDLPIEMGGEAL